MVTQQQYNNFREDALHRQPIRKSVLLSDLKFHTMDTVEYAGVLLGMNRTALKNLIGIVGFSVSGTDAIKSQVGEEQSVNILNALKNVISSAKGIEITLTVTPDRVITGIHRTRRDAPLPSIESFFDTVQRLGDKGLTVKSTSFNPDNGNVSVEMMAKGGGEFQVGGLSDEVFNSGISISRTANGIAADPYLHRLVCTNGMVTRQFEESFKMKTGQPKMWEEFYKHLDDLERRDFKPAKFDARLLRAANTPASLQELERGIGLLNHSAKLETNDLEIFFRGMKRTYNALHSSGIDTDKLTPKQKANIRTALPVWDVINGITDFASHNYGYEKAQNSDRHLMMQAGDLLCKDFDSENIISNQPF